MKPHRSAAYLARVRIHPCCIGGNCQGEVVPHHAFGMFLGGGKGLKGSDFGAVPLCMAHHRAVHDGNTELSDDVKMATWVVENLLEYVEVNKMVDVQRKAVRILLGAMVRDLIEALVP